MSSTIGIIGCDLDVTILPSAEFSLVTNKLYGRPKFSDEYTFDEYITEKRNTEDALRLALSSRWVQHDDFEVGSDGNIAFTLCGGIYSPRMICRDYLETLYRVLRTTRMWGRWAYSTSLELQQPIRGLTLTEFVLRGTTLIVDSNLAQFDFVEYFSRPLEASGFRLPS